MHDSGVNMNFGIRANRLDGFRQKVERDWCSVKLTATVVGEDNSVCASRDRELRVFDVLDALNYELALPLLTNPLEIFEGHGWVEHLV